MNSQVNTIKHDEKYQADVLKAALKYLEMGWRPLPAVYAAKRPSIAWQALQKNYTLTPEFFTEHYKNNPNDGVGIITGNRLVVVDKDAQSAEWLADIELHGQLPPTLEAESTPSQYNNGLAKGHLFFSLPAGVEIRNDAGSIWGGIDIRGDGGFVVCAPSTHESKTHKYRWLNWGTAIAPCPGWIIEKAKKSTNGRKKVGRPKKDTQLLEAFRNGVDDGHRDDIMFNLIVKRMQYAGWDYDWAYAVMEQWNDKCRPPLGEAVLREKMDRLYHPTELLTVTNLEDVETKPLLWLWKPWIPRGKLTLLCGDGEIGKSYLLCDLVTKITRGYALPDGTKAESGIVLWLTEETFDDVLKPRLEEAGADLTKIKGLSSHGFSLRSGLLALEKVLEEYRPILLIIDPIETWSGIDGNSPQQIQVMLEAFGDLIARYETGAIGVRHLSKRDTDKAVQKIGGAMDWFNKARSVIGIDYDPADDNKRIMAHMKSNNALRARPMGYTIESGNNLDYARIQWHGDIQGMNHNDIWGNEQGESGRAVVMLKEFVGDDGCMPQQDVLSEAVEIRGISKTTLDRAKKMANYRSKKRSDGHWDWLGPNYSTGP